ncbi:MAG: hypothetical protein SFV54_07435 [Bryobacteraceae bacterium]|nr:hypothetical protein [Bryobacteraceae bacterium]
MPRVKVRLASGELGGPLRQLRAFLLSLAIHGGVCALLFSLPPAAFRAAPQNRLRFTITPLPAREPLIWYAPKKLPNIEPTQKFGEGPEARGEQKSDGEVIIARSPEARSKSQLIFQPDTPKVLEREVPSPNLVTAPAPKRVAKPFEPPPAPVEKARPDSAALAEPDIQVKATAAEAGALGAVHIKAKPRVFEAPQQARLTVPEGVMLEAPPPELRAGAGTGVAGSTLLGAAPSKAPKPAAKQFVPPPAAGPGGTGTGKGSSAALTEPGLDVTRGSGAAMQAAVVGLNPSAVAAPPPPGSLPGSFSRAPNVGPAASGDLTGRADARIPDLMVRGAGSGAPVPPPPVAPRAARSQLVFEVAPHQYGDTYSAPLRPSAGIVPPAIERIFPGRAVYTLVIPAPKMSRYTDDWVIWFTEKSPLAGVQNPLLRAPLPARKRAGGVPDAAAEMLEERVRYRVSIGLAGLPEGVAMVRAPRQGDAELAMAEMLSWEFYPSTRNGQPIEVEAVIEIPLRLPVKGVLKP